MNSPIPISTARTAAQAPSPLRPEALVQRKADAMEILKALIVSKHDSVKPERLCLEAYRLADLMESLADLGEREMSDRRSKLGFA